MSEVTKATETQNAIAKYSGDDDFKDMRARDRIQPRLRLQQALSPGVIDGKFRGGDLVATGEDTVVVPLGKATTMIPLIHWYNWVEYNPDRKSEKKVLNMSFDASGELARTAEAFIKIKNSEGKEVQKVTEYHNWAVLLPDVSHDYESVYIISFAKTAHKVGKLWYNRQFKMKIPGTSERAPMWMFGYAFSAKKAEKDGNKWFEPQFGDANVTPEAEWEGLNLLRSALNEGREAMMKRAAEQEAADGANDATGEAQREF